MKALPWGSPCGAGVHASGGSPDPPFFDRARILQDPQVLAEVAHA